MTPDDPVIAAFRRAASDRGRGAAEIESALIRELLGLRAQWTSAALSRGSALLAAGQPTMANLRSLALRAEAAAAGAAGRAELAGHLAERLEALEQLSARLAAAAWSQVEGAARLVTLSRSSAVAAVVEGARALGWNGRVVVLDGSSAGRGPEQAAALAASGPALSQPDATAVRWLNGDRVVVAVGADAVGGQRFVNCVGTTALLELAAARGLPRLLVAGTGKDVPDAVLDEMTASIPLYRDAAGREWPLFETVPIDLVTVRISEGF